MIYHIIICNLFNKTPCIVKVGGVILQDTTAIRIKNILSQDKLMKSEGHIRKGIRAASNMQIRRSLNRKPLKDSKNSNGKGDQSADLY